MEPQSAPPLGSVLVAVALFGASGAAALIYQIVWLEQLSLAIGSSALSLGVLLATFLGGLCIGSLIASRLAWPTRALHRYALLELLIGALGVLALHAIPALGAVHTAVAGTAAVGVGSRLFVAILALLPPTILMGATLPVIAVWLRRTGRGTAWLGLCYGANAAGGVVGCVLAGFYLLRVHDVYVATGVAVGLNLLVAAAAVLLARRPNGAAGDAAPSPAARGAPASPTIYAVAALSGLTALAAEVLWTRHLSLLLGGTVYTFALILAVFLAGLALGSAAGAALGQRCDARKALAACQWLLCVAMALAAYALARSLPYWPIDVALPVPAGVALTLDVLRASCVAAVPALLWGASFPLALAAATQSGAAPERVVGPLFAANTAGAIAGALLTTFVLVVTLGSQRTQQLMILVSACSALVLSLTPQRGARVPRWATAALAGAALLLALGVPALPPELVAYGRFLPTRGSDANVIYVGEGLTSSIAVSAESSGILTYHNAGKTQASTYPQDMRLQRMLGHLTTLIPAQPASVLVIGLGAGVTAGAVAIDPAVERVVVAEIEPLVPVVAARYFGAANFDVVANDKVEIRLDDGRHFLATTAERFDAITSDPLDPWVKGAAALYTREFWQLCKARLNDGGVVTVFVQLYESTEAAVRSEIATFLDVFPNGFVLANTVEGQGYDAVLVGRADGKPIDLTHIERRLQRADYTAVASSLRAVGFDSALDLMSTYVAQGDSLAPWLQRAELNTDRNLRLQYLAGRGLNVFEAAGIFSALVGDGPAYPERLFSGSPAQLEELRQRLTARQGRY